MARLTLRHLQSLTFVSNFDRMLIAPLLPAIAVDLGVSVGVAAGAATSYFVGYGLMQAAWGVLSDRLGRLRVLRLALALSATAAIASALAPSAAALVVLRALTGASFAALMPGTLIYIGDTVPAHQRHGPLTDIMRATALGMALATAVGGALGETLGWRAALALPGILAVVLLVAVRRTEDPPVATRPAAFGAVLSNGWALLVLALGFLEGAVLLGALPLLPTVLQLGGLTLTASGLVTAGYGVAVIVLTPVAKALGRRLPAPALMAGGAVMGVLAHLLLALDQGPVAVFVGTVLIAATWAFAHSALQAWVTGVVPEARASMVSMFATSLFLGTAAGTGAGAGLLEAGHIPAFFAGAAITMAVVGIAMTWGRHRDRA